MDLLKIAKSIVLLFAILSGFNFQSLRTGTPLMGMGTVIPLIDAVDSGNYNDVEALLKSGADINVQDWRGGTALMHALTLPLFSPDSEWLKIINLLLQYKPDLSKNDQTGETAMAKAVKAGLFNVVDLLWSKLTIANKSSFVSFEQNDWNGAIVESLARCLFEKVICIVVPQLLQVFFKSNKYVEHWQAGKITFFASRLKSADAATPQLLVIIPASLEELGIQLPESEKQKVMPTIDISSVENKYGFKNLELINPAFVSSLVANAKAGNNKEVKNILTTFRNIINSESPQHPTRFYLSGHGNIGLIASIPLSLFGDFLIDLADIGTEFIYIDSCYTAGNIAAIQSALGSIITQQIDERKKSKTVPLPGVDYAIVIQATTDVSTMGIGNVKAMFEKLDEFLIKPVWALEFGPGVKKPKITIPDVISPASIGFSSESLPSIRFPGKTGYFRSINIGNMEIITESRLIQLGVEKTLELIAESKNPDKNIAGAAKKKLAGPLDIEILIKHDITNIQIFPIDLLDFTFVIEGQYMLRFISKLTGMGQHFIGKIVDNSDKDIKNFINQRFVDIFWSKWGYKADRCWFIKSVDIPTTKTHIKKLAIRLWSENNLAQHEYAYSNEKGEYFIYKKGNLESKIDKDTFESIVRGWFNETSPLQQTLTEATGGIEVADYEKERLLREKGGTQALKRLEFARTPMDLFAMFMAD